MARKVVLVVLMTMTSIALVAWVFTYWLDLPLRWENHTDFLKPGHVSLTLARFGIGIAFTDQVDVNRARSWRVFGLRVNVLGVYSRSIRDGSSISVLAPRTILLRVSFPVLIGLLLLYPGYLIVRIGIRLLRRKEFNSHQCRSCG